MEPIFIFAAIVAIIGGFFEGIDKCNKCKLDQSLGVKPSQNLFTFLFLDS